jgi:hypothetical protein
VDVEKLGERQARGMIIQPIQLDGLANPHISLCPQGDTVYRDNTNVRGAAYISRLLILWDLAHRASN